MCKPNKMNHANPRELGHTGFGKIRDDIHTEEDLKDALGHDSEEDS